MSMKATMSSILANFKADDYKDEGAPSLPPPKRQKLTFDPLPSNHPALSAPSRSQRSSAGMTAASSSGRVIWYNGRRQVGKMVADDGRDYHIPPGGAMNRNVVPLTAGGLMHGTRVRCLPVNSDNSAQGECLSVRPDLSVQAGLSCGVERRSSQQDMALGQFIGHLAAADIADLGFIAGVFNGHNGSNCAQHVSQFWPSLLHDVYTAHISRLPKTGWNGVSVDEEVEMMSAALRESFEATDRHFMQAAQQQNWTDGACAVVTLLAHGFEAPPDKCTVEGTSGGVAKLFVAWCGDCRAILLKGSKKAQRLTKDHNPDRKDEYERIKASGGKVLEIDGQVKVGRRDKYKEKKKDLKFREVEWLPTSRAFGDIRLKVPHPVVISVPDVHVHTLTPQDWGVVLVCNNVVRNMSDQEVVNICWRCMIEEKLSPEAAAKELANRAEQKGSGQNLSVVVMRLGWVNPISLL
eukprot:gnl/MRDRNA2_/MRDRNA2_103209_c0_seq1.p1 gnl/MRDRNA2_/MRDRNA2_103209_c0~~gnl/MRDRNA2_/MRDRNA2_103209_c0_seq1.p1  ORF type:complete len:464 (+),score=91.47 gnl/MRDRNA2_/MRDRNA2_103209_c0_seq1:80-1471(+)